MMDATCMQQLLFRPLQQSDVDELKALHAELFPIDYDNAFFEKAVSSADRLFSYAAVHHSNSGKQRLVGFITARLMYAYECDPTDRYYLGFGSPALASTPMVYILTLGVTKAWQGRGLARMLLQQVHSHAQAMRWRAVFLHVITYNHAAIRLYTSQSYRCLACLQDFYTISTGRQLDPECTTYDAYLYGVLLPNAHDQACNSAMQWHGAAAWNLAMAPIRNVLGHFNTCMPWLCSQGPAWLPQGMGAHAQPNTREASYLLGAEPCVNGFNRNHSGTLECTHQEAAPFGLPGPERTDDVQAWEQPLLACSRSQVRSAGAGAHIRSHMQRRPMGDGIVQEHAADMVHVQGHHMYAASEDGGEVARNASNLANKACMPMQACSQQAYAKPTGLQPGAPGRRSAPGSQSLLQWLTLPSR